MNNTPDHARMLPRCPPDLELEIREALPVGVKQFALEKMFGAVDWRELAELTAKRGEAGALQVLKQLNAEAHAKAHGRGFYQRLSPWRNY